MRSVVFASLSALAFAAFPAFAADVSQEAIDACIDELRATGLPDGQSGTVLSTEFSEANSLVMLRDAGESTWKCLVSNDGVVAELVIAQAADDGEGAMAGAPSGPERVQFDAGTSGAELSGSLMPGDSKSYFLDARNEQFLYVRLAADGPDMYYQILNPDGSFLLDQMSADKEYRGQLWQSGDHVVEVINRGNGTQSYTVIFGIE